jgi:predicted membrane-bound dolichyl-phosphate-mannose-protein mannosyltransferase
MGHIKPEWLSYLETHARALSYLELVGIVIVFVVRVLSGGHPAPFDPASLQIAYNSVQAGHPARFTDDMLYAYAGWTYVHGLSPDQLNFEHPPLAKYLIGVSELLFHDPVTLGIIFAAVTLVIVYLISSRLMPRYFVLVPVWFLGFDRLFIYMSALSLLDIYVTSFVAASVLLFFVFRHSKWLPIVSGLSIGLAVASKWPAVFVIPALFAYVALERDMTGLRSLVLSLPIAALAYVSTYGVFFLQGHSLMDFIALQLRMLSYQSYMRFGRGSPPHFWLLFNFITGIEGPGSNTLVVIDTAKMIISTIGVQYGFSLLVVFNPFTWTASVPATFGAVFYGWKQNQRAVILPPLLFWSLVLLTSYGLVFYWYILPALPFAFISLSYVLWHLTKKVKLTIRLPIMIAYLAAMAVWSYFQFLPSFIVVS